MSPEFGSTCAYFPIDDETLRYLRFTGRPEAQVALVEAYAKEQGLWPADVPSYSETLELDLGSVVPSLAGPRRPQDRVLLDDVQRAFRAVLPEILDPNAVPATSVRSWVDEASEESFPASDAPAIDTDGPTAHAPVGHPRVPGALPDRPRRPTEVLLDGTPHLIDHGAVAIAAITSCTNTSNPSVMVAAGLLARNAVERGPAASPG